MSKLIKLSIFKLTFSFRSTESLNKLECFIGPENIQTVMEFINVQRVIYCKLEF